MGTGALTVFVLENDDSFLYQYPFVYYSEKRSGKKVAQALIRDIYYVKGLLTVFFIDFIDSKH